MNNITDMNAIFNLLLVDDHTVVREGIKHLLVPISKQWAITEADSGFAALSELRQQDFDLAIVDLSMPGMTGLELIQRIKANYPSVLILVLSMHAEEQYAIRAFKAGANGYLTKDGAGAELLNAVRKVRSGGTYVTPSLAERVFQQLRQGTPSDSHAALSDRELEVLRRFVAGQRPIDIAHDLHLSIKTVSTHKTRIQEKLQLPSMAALIRYGLEHQLDKGDLAIGKDEL